MCGGISEVSSAYLSRSSSIGYRWYSDSDANNFFVHDRTNVLVSDAASRFSLSLSSSISLPWVDIVLRLYADGVSGDVGIMGARYELLDARYVLPDCRREDEDATTSSFGDRAS